MSALIAASLRRVADLIEAHDLTIGGHIAHYADGGATVFVSTPEDVDIWAAALGTTTQRPMLVDPEGKDAFLSYEAVDAGLRVTTFVYDLAAVEAPREAEREALELSVDQALLDRHEVVA